MTMSKGDTTVAGREVSELHFVDFLPDKSCTPVAEPQLFPVEQEPEDVCPDELVPVLVPQKARMPRAAPTPKPM